MTNNVKRPEDYLTEHMGAAFVIQKLGGIRPAAALLGVAASTVQGWKERGVIPQNREQSILDIATRHNIDLSKARTVDKTVALTAETSPKKSDSRDALQAAPAAKKTTQTSVELADSAIAKTGRPTNGVAWIALMLAGGVLITTITQPKWAPVLFPQTSTTTLPSPALKDLLGNEFAGVERRIAALAGDLSDLSTGTESAALLPEFSLLNNRLDVLESANGEYDSKTKFAGSILELGDRLTVLEGQMSTKGADNDTAVAIDSLRTGILTLRVDVTTWSERLAALEAVPTIQVGGVAALVLAVGQLEGAIDTGGPFVGALERVRTFGGGDLVVAEALALISVWTAVGIQTEAALRLRFTPLMSELEQSIVTDTANDRWWPRLRRQMSGLVTVRRVGLANKLSPVEQIELAVKRGDLERAVVELALIAHLHSETVQVWLVDARARVEAESALRLLRSHVLDLLGKVGATTQ